MTLARTVEMAYLLDFYGPLLTERQRRLCDLYWSHDWSLSEIAEDAGVSRQAVHDLLRRATAALQGYEEKLGLYRRFRQQQEQLREVEQALERGTPEGVAAARELLQQLLQE